MYIPFRSPKQGYAGGIICADTAPFAGATQFAATMTHLAGKSQTAER